MYAFLFMCVCECLLCVPLEAGKSVLDGLEPELVNFQIGVLRKRECSHCGDTLVLSLLLELYSPFVPFGLRFLLFRVSCILEFPVLPHYFIFALV